MGALLVFGVLALLILGVVVWLLFDDSLVHIQPGEIGLVLVNGRPTDKTLSPGIRYVPTLRRMMLQRYPSLVLAYRSGDADGLATRLEHSGPAVSVALGDRTSAGLSYTIRFRLDQEHLRSVHERFGPDGIWSAVRDVSSAALFRAANAPDVSIRDALGTNRLELEDRFVGAITDALVHEGFLVDSVTITSIDLGRADLVVQSIVRSRLDLEREVVAAELRSARAEADALLVDQHGGPADSALRYRELESWSDVAWLLAERGQAARPSSSSSWSSPVSSVPLPAAGAVVDLAFLGDIDESDGDEEPDLDGEPR